MNERQNDRMNEQAVDGTAGEREVSGAISIVQEDRFRLEVPSGQSLLLILGRGAGASSRDLARIAGTGRTVSVRYRGQPDAGAVVVRVRPRVGNP